LGEGREGVCLFEREDIFFSYIKKEERTGVVFFLEVAFLFLQIFRDKKKLTLNVRDAIIAYYVIVVVILSICFAFFYSVLRTYIISNYGLFQSTH